MRIKYLHNEPVNKIFAKRQISGYSYSRAYLVIETRFIIPSAITDNQHCTGIYSFRRARTLSILMHTLKKPRSLAPRNINSNRLRLSRYIECKSRYYYTYTRVGGVGRRRRYRRAKQVICA